MSSNATQQQSQPSFDDIHKARNLVHESELKLYGAHEKVVPPTDDNNAEATVKPEHAHQEGDKTSNPAKSLMSRVLAPFEAHAAGLNENIDSQHPPANQDVPAVPQAEAKNGEATGYEYSQGIVAKDAPGEVLQQLPDTFSRVGESVGRGVQYVAGAAVDAGHNLAHTFDTGATASASQSRKEAEEPNASDSPARKRDTLVDHVTYPFSKDVDDPSPAVELARSYNDYVAEKREEAAKNFPGIDVNTLHPGNFPNVPESKVHRSTHTQLETSVKNTGSDSIKASPDVKEGQNSKGTEAPVDDDNASSMVASKDTRSGLSKSVEEVPSGAATDTPADNSQGGVLGHLASKVGALLGGNRAGVEEPAGATEETHQDA